VGQLKSFIGPSSCWYLL